ncbi:prolipoprotein diacylglyceryl transferase [Clostridium sp. CAG:433]|jgi:phosphatidylglycerol:prolipoprotein diacylglycerol transferase|nr:prolipoprotein diacylglyceryl transferase [Clostridium sp. CAG:433]
MNRVAFNIFGFNVYYYSLCILLGVIVAYILITREGKKQGLPKEFISDLIFYTLIIGILGARVYYCVFNLDYYLANPSEILKIYNGGLAIHGGVIAGFIFVYFYTKKKNVSFIKILDIVAPAVIIAQSFGRWGNFFNQEAHGGITTYQNLKNMHIPEFIINGMHIEGKYYYPTFFFESIWCLIGFIILMIARKNKNLRKGFQIGFYFIWYGIGRFFIEALRTDSLMFFGLKIAQIVSLIGIIIGIIIIVTNRNKKYYNEMEVK